MQKFFVIMMLLILSSCSLIGNKAPTTFEEYYTRNMRATIDSTEKMLESLGFFRSTETSGIFDALVSVPILLSGSLMTEYNVQSDGRNASLAVTNGKFEYDGLAGSGFLSFDKLGLISESGNLHILYKNLQDFGLSTAEMREVWNKFDGTWLSWTQEEARSAIEDPAELQAMTILENISKMDKKQIERYLVSYPIWRSTEDMGMSGALHMYKVELDREKILSLMNVIRTELTGSGFSTDEQSALREQLALIGLSGTMGFHSDSTHITDTQLSLIDGSGTILGTFSVQTEEDKTRMILTSAQEDITLDYTYTDSELRDDMMLVVTQSGAELVKMVGYMDSLSGKFHEFSLDVTAQGITVALKHTQKGDGTFDGRLLLPVGSISWNGAVTDKRLTALKVLGASPMGAIDMDLTQSGELIRGPFILKVGNEEVMRAIVGLVVEPKRFRFALDVPQGTGSTDMVHGELGWTMKTSDFSGKIKSPSPTRPLKDLMTELENIAPEMFIEEPREVLDESQYMMDEIDSLEPTGTLQ